MSNAQKLVLQYWSIIANQPIEFLESVFDSVDWMKDRAIKCAILNVKSEIKLLELANVGSATSLLITKETEILKELEAMVWE